MSPQQLVSAVSAMSCLYVENKKPTTVGKEKGGKLFVGISGPSQASKEYIWVPRSNVIVSVM